MHIPATASGGERRQRLLSFARSNDAQLYAIRTNLTSAEVTRLGAALNQLVGIGALALYRLETPPVEAADWTGVVTYLQQKIGALCTDAAFAAAAYPATPTPKPQSLLPVWPFERLPDHAEVLAAYGLFLGLPILFEALPVLDAEPAEPTPEVVTRFLRWRIATGPDAMLGTVALPGTDVAHVVFASVRSG